MHQERDVLLYLVFPMLSACVLFYRMANVRGRLIPLVLHFLKKKIAENGILSVF